MIKPARLLIAPLFALLAVFPSSLRAAVFTPPTSNQVAVDFNADPPAIVLWETSLNEFRCTNAPTSIQAIAHAEYLGGQMLTSGWITTLFTLCSEQAGVRSSADTGPLIIDKYGLGSQEPTCLSPNEIPQEA